MGWMKLHTHLEKENKILSEHILQQTLNSTSMSFNILNDEMPSVIKFNKVRVHR
jgi:hypothetical protein